MLTAATNTKKHQVTPAPAHARMGFAIAKKLVKRAVGRNYLKRVAREVFRKHTLKHEQVDLVVRLNPEAKPANTRFIPDNFSNLEQDLVAAFNAVRATALKPMVL